MKGQNKSFSFEGENIFVGIDVHKTQWKVSIIGEHVTHKTFSQPPDADKLYQYLDRHFPKAAYICAYEAGFSGFGTYDRLNTLGIKTIVAHAADIPTTDKDRRQKEDKRDSRKIARSLRAGELTPIRVPTAKNRSDRQLLRVRRSLVKDIQRNKNRIKGFLFFNGINHPERFKQSGTHWSKVYMNWLESLTLNEPTAKESLKVLIDNTHFLRKQLLAITRQIRHLSTTESYGNQVSLLCSVPGIGLITAMTFLTELEDIEHYQSLDKLCSYIGLVPSTNSSGDTQRVGGITPRGKKHLRSMIVESTWIAVRRDPVMMKKFHELCRQMKPNKAIVRMAKKLVSRIRYVLKNQKKYQILTQ